MSHWPQCPLEWNWTGSSELNAAFNRNACSMWYCSCPCHRMRIFFLLTSNAHILPPENEFKKCINLNILLGLVGASQWTYLRHHCFHFLSFNLLLTYLTFYLNKFTKVCRLVIISKLCALMLLRSKMATPATKNCIVLFTAKTGCDVIKNKHHL